MLEKTNEDHHATLQIIKVAKTWSMSHYESHIHPHTFSEGDLFLVYDQAHDKTRKGKFESMWYGPYVIHRCLGKWAYLLSHTDNRLLKNPHNGLYLKISYA